MTGAPKACLTSSVSAGVAELTEILTSFEKVVPRPVEIIDLLRSFSRCATTFDLDLLPAVRAGEDRITVELSQRGFELLFALRAIEIPADFICKSGHDSVSVGLVGTTNEGRAPGESQGSSGEHPGNTHGRPSISAASSPSLCSTAARAAGSFPDPMLDSARLPPACEPRPLASEHGEGA